MNKRERLTHLLRVESVRPKKYNYGAKQVVVMPSPVQKKDLNDYKYARDIDEKVVKMACNLAEKMAIAMVRETIGHIDSSSMVDKIVAALSDKISEAIPDQTTIIQQVVSEQSTQLKSELNGMIFEGANLAIDRSKGLKLHGKVGEKTESEDSTDDALDMLDNLQL